jgi:flagellar biosynthetic protein FlhB
LLCGCGTAGYLATSFVQSITQSLKSSLTTTTITPLTIESAFGMVRGATGSTASILLPFLIAILACGVVANLIQTGWLWSPLLRMPTFRLSSVISGTKMYEAFSRMLRISIIATLVWTFWFANRWRISLLSSGEPSTLIADPARLIAEFCLPLTICILVIALIDYGVRYWKNERSLMMTVEEQRREQRDDGVNPAVKQRRLRDL